MSKPLNWWRFSVLQRALILFKRKKNYKSPSNLTYSSILFCNLAPTSILFFTMHSSIYLRKYVYCPWRPWLIRLRTDICSVHGHACVSVTHVNPRRAKRKFTKLCLCINVQSRHCSLWAWVCLPFRTQWTYKPSRWQDSLYIYVINSLGFRFLVHIYSK